MGHIISQEGVATDPDKTSIVQNYPVPTNVSQVRSFLGITGYYRRYIHKYSQITEPLTNLMRKNTSFVWSNECQHSFEALKQKLVKPPILAYPKFDGTRFILQTDASVTGLAYILSQIQDDAEKVIAYGGRSLSISPK